LHSKPASTAPYDNGDGTLSGLLIARIQCEPYGLIVQLALPQAVSGGPVAGRFFMLRCVEDTPSARRLDWSTYPRRPLFVAGLPAPHAASGGDRWDLFVPATDEMAIRWLATRALGDSLNVTGPFGVGHTLPATSRTLLSVSHPAWLPHLLPWIHAMLDQGGRVALVLDGSSDIPAALRPWLPIPVEAHPAPTVADLTRHLATALRWADHCVLALTADRLPLVATLIRQQRFRLEPGYAVAVAASDLICGFGACLACIVPSAGGGYTRTCLHGPVLPLEDLTP
jgi:hypothetical protein